MIDCYEIINRFYERDTELWHILVTHSEQVASLAVQIGERLVARGEPVDVEFVNEASLLHDIGIFRTDAPGIACYGTEPYICHGVIGSDILSDMGLFRHALVCERHTGAGLTVSNIEIQNLPLPRREMLPLSIEEKIVCYADKFFSKSHVGAPAKPVDKVRLQMERFGADSLARFNALHAMFA